jgi:hypothetical protein
LVGVLYNCYSYMLGIHVMLTFEQLEDRVYAASVAIDLRLVSDVDPIEVGREFDVQVWVEEYHPIRILTRVELELVFDDELMHQSRLPWITDSLPGGFHSEHNISMAAYPGLGAGQAVGNLGWEHIATLHMESTQAGPATLAIDPSLSRLGTSPVSSIRFESAVDGVDPINIDVVAECTAWLPEHVDAAVAEMEELKNKWYDPGWYARNGPALLPGGEGE